MEIDPQFLDRVQSSCFKYVILQFFNGSSCCLEIPTLVAAIDLNVNEADNNNKHCILRLL